MSRELFVNIHLTKCGGHTFCSVLRRNFRDAYSEVYAPIWEDPYTAEQIAGLAIERPGIECLSTHRLSLDLPFGDERFRLHPMCFVRDPIDRLLSMYFYQRGLERAESTQRNDRFRAWSSMGPLEFADSIVAESPGLGNSQFHQLLKRAPDRRIDVVNDLCEGGRLALMPLERFDDALLVLRRLHPERFTDLRYVPQNRSRRDVSVPDRARETLREITNLDRQLVELAHRWLDARIAELWTSRSEFDRERRELERTCRWYGRSRRLRSAFRGRL